jgi:hypothetical protein
MSNSDDSDPILWESEEFIYFLLVIFIQVTIRDNRPILTRSAILQPSLAPWDRLSNFGGDDGSRSVLWPKRLIYFFEFNSKGNCVLRMLKNSFAIF